MKKLKLLKLSKLEESKILGGACNTFKCSESDNCSSCSSWAPNSGFASGYTYNRSNGIYQHD